MEEPQNNYSEWEKPVKKKHCMILFVENSIKCKLEWQKAVGGRRWQGTTLEAGLETFIISIGWQWYPGYTHFSKLIKLCPSNTESLPNTSYTLVKLPKVRVCKSHLLMHQNIDQWPILSDTQTFHFPGVNQPAVLFPVTAAEGHREYP